MTREARLRPAPAAQAGPWWREPWPWILMAGPAAVIVAGAVTVWLAVATSDGLVAEDYYRRGLAINQDLRREQAALERGVNPTVTREGSRLGVRLARETPEALIAHLAHATRAGHDLRLRLSRAADGSYEAQLPALPAGRWRLVIEDPRREWRVVREGP